MNIQIHAIIQASIIFSSNLLKESITLQDRPHFSIRSNYADMKQTLNKEADENIASSIEHNRT
jgi:hypothetical protein